MLLEMKSLLKIYVFLHREDFVEQKVPQTANFQNNKLDHAKMSSPDYCALLFMTEKSVDLHPTKPLFSLDPDNL